MTTTFAAGALLVSSVLALGTYFTARHLLVDQREQTATRQAFSDASLVRDSLKTSGSQVSDVLGSISPPAEATIYVRRAGVWYSSALDSAGPETTSAVQEIVSEGAVGIAWTDATEPHSVVVGVPLPAVNAEYYEVTVARELDSTLSTLWLALAICAGLTTVAGALVGRAASRQALAPLRDVARAAVRVSEGDLSARLDQTDDPDLAALVGSFNHMVDALMARIQQDARFAADVSHELRTPLTTLTTSLSLLQTTPDLSPQASRAVVLMANELTRFRQALMDLLALGRLDAGAHETRPTVVGVRELVEQALLSSGRPATLLAIDPGGLVDPQVEVDRAQLARALVNLFHNADLHGQGLTRVSVAEHRDTVEVRVEDHGPGVPTEERTRIFERFARAGGQKVGTGSGLGLSIVEQTVRNHGGDVRCVAASGGGAVFVMSLPLVARSLA